MTFEDNNRSGGQQASREIVELVFAVVAVDHYKPARLLTGRAGQRVQVRLTFRGNAKQTFNTLTIVSKSKKATVKTVIPRPAHSLALEVTPTSS